MKVCSCSPQKTEQNSILSFLAPPYRLALAKVMLDKLPWEERCSETLLLPSPITDITPLPDQLPPNAFYRHLSSRSATGAVINGTGPDGCLPELDMFPLLQVMSLWYMCFCAEVFFFLFSHCTPQWSIVWGVKFFFSSLSSCKCCIFLHSLSSCSVYPVVICMLCMYGQVDG